MRTSSRPWAGLAASLLLPAAACAAPPAPPGAPAAIGEIETARLLDYLRGQGTTGFLVVRHGRTLIERQWPAPAAPGFAVFVHGRTKDRQLLEDVASQQKSFVSVLVAIAAERGLIDPERPVSDYLGPGWSKASPAQEAAIRVVHVLTMSSGLDESFGYQAPAGTRFFYNTPVYAVLKPVLAKATGSDLATLTRDWLTAKLGMPDTGWRQRPAALGNVGNATGLVTTPRDMARFGAMILAGGVAADGGRILSQASLRAMLSPSPANPAYGRLWWLNGGDHAIDATGRRRDGRLFPAAPPDMVAALGFLDRRLYIVPSLNLIVVRTGAAASDPKFDRNLWHYLNQALGIAEPRRGDPRAAGS